LAINDAHALYLSLDHVWPASSSHTGKPTKEQIADVFRLYEATRQPQVNKLLGVVHKAIAGQKVTLERGKTETDEQLRRRVLDRMDPWWISEHDIERAFREAIDKLKEGGEDRAKL
jgi:salicylate hydroxylase